MTSSASSIGSRSTPSVSRAYQPPASGRLAVQRLYADREGLLRSVFSGTGAKSVKIPWRTVAIGVVRDEPLPGQAPEPLRDGAAVHLRVPGDVQEAIAPDFLGEELGEPVRPFLPSRCGRIGRAACPLEEKLQVVAKGEADLPVSAAEPHKPARLHQAVEPGGIVGREPGGEELFLPGLGRRRESEELVEPLLQVVHRVAGRGEPLPGGEKEGEVIDGERPERGASRPPGHPEEDLQVFPVADFDLPGLFGQEVEDHLLRFGKPGERLVEARFIEAEELPEGRFPERSVEGEPLQEDLREGALLLRPRGKRIRPTEILDKSGYPCAQGLGGERIPRVEPFDVRAECPGDPGSDFR